MAREAAEAAAGARRQIATYSDRFAQLADRLRARPPAVIVTCARGSSDHAATYGKYLLETTVGRVVASVGPSIASTYGRVPVLDGALFLAISQSGQSPDLLRLTAAARTAGALVVAIVNDTSSPLAASAEIVLPLCAGVETSVAATKSFLLSGVALLQLAAAWTEQRDLQAAVAAAPDALAAAAQLDWMPGLADLASATNLFVIARGIGLGAAQEVALKLKETCRLHAEAFSAAELRHGPIALVGPGFPIVALAQDDSTLPVTREAITQLAALGASVRSTLDGSLPEVPGIPAVLAPLCQVQTFYLAAPKLAAARGHDADAPSQLRKVTETV